MAAEQKWKNWIQLLLGLGLTFLFFYMMAPFVVAFLIGAIITIISFPLYKWLNRRLPAAISSAIVTLGITLGIVAPLVGLLLAVITRLIDLVGRFRAKNETSGLEDLLHGQAYEKLISLLARVTPFDKEWLHEQAALLFKSVLAILSNFFTNTAASMPGFLLGLSVILISVFFLLKDGKNFLAFLESLSPVRLDKAQAIFASFESSCRGVVLSLFAAAIVQGVIMTIFSYFCDLDAPLLLGMLTIIMGMVPLVGAAPLWVGAVIYLALSGSYVLSIIMLLGGILMSASDNVVRPLVLQEHSKMHPLLALVSVFGAIDLVGAPGIFLGPIIAAVFVSFLELLRTPTSSLQADRPKPS